MKWFTIFQFMLISLLVTFFALGSAPHISNPMHPLPPLPPNTATAASVDVAAAAEDVEKTLHPELQEPERLVIPSIHVDSPVARVGVNAAGEMDVPDGSTKTVGWYQYGTVPGNTGSAVMDAHVYAAFSKLKSLQTGSDIYVKNKRGETLRFRVVAAQTYPLAQVPMETIFNDASGSYLNFITCAGKYNRASGTYSHRLVVYAKLVE